MKKDKILIRPSIRPSNTHPHIYARKRLLGYKDKLGEKRLERRLVEEVSKRGGIALKFSSDTMTGFPDRLVLMPNGHASFVEVKTEGEKPRKLQLYRHDQLRELGFKVWILDSEEMLNEIMNEICG